MANPLQLKDVEIGTHILLAADLEKWSRDPAGTDLVLYQKLGYGHFDDPELEKKQREDGYVCLWKSEQGEMPVLPGDTLVVPCFAEL